MPYHVRLCKNEKFVKPMDLDFNTMGDAYGLNSASFPMILLIDPKGNIIATGLRGEAIESTVATALAKK